MKLSSVINNDTYRRTLEIKNNGTETGSIIVLKGHGLIIEKNKKKGKFKDTY